MEKVSQKVCKAYGFILRLCFFCAVVGLLLLSLVCICYMETSEYVYLCADASTSQTLLLVGSFLTAVGIGLAAKKGRFQWKSLPALRFALLALAGILGVVWVLNTRYIPRADRLSILQFAEHLRKKEYGAFGAGTYMARYPHQSGMVLFLCGLSYLWGDGNYVAFQLLNVGAYLVILWTLGELSRRLGRGTVVPTLLGLLFLPLLFYTSFLYGTLLGLAMALLAAVETVDYCHKGTAVHGILAGVFLLLALVFKSNYQIFALGLGIYAAVYLLTKKAGKRWPVLAVLLLAFVLGTKLPIACMEQITGQDFSHGSTTLAWVVMGLHDDGNQAPGRYDGYVWSTLDDAELDAQRQKARVRQDLKERLDYLVKNPKYTAQMLVKKTASQWCDPLFEGHWILQQMKSDYDIPEQLRAVSAPVGSWHMSRLLNYLHIWLLFGAALLIFSGKEELSPEMLLLMTVFVGGFVFHTFWEAKGQYTLPYFVLLIPLAVQGYWSVITAAKTGGKTLARRYGALLALVLAVNLAVKIHPIQGLWTDLVRFYRYLGI